MRFHYLLLTSMLLLPLVAVHGQEATTSTTTVPAEVVPAAVDTPRNPEVRRAALSAIAQVSLTNLAANLSNRLDAYVRRITNVTTRLESRATRMKAEGIDVSAAEAKINDAKRELDSARGTLATIDIEVAAFVGSQNPRERWQTLRTSYESARTAIFAAHKATVEAVLLLKTAGNSAPTGTSTDTISDTVQ